VIVLAPALVLATLALAALHGPATTKLSSPQEPGGVFRAATELVTLNVTVTDGQDRQLPGLGASDFIVLEDGRPQEIRFFASSDVPLDVALLIDTSSSMADKLEAAREAARSFLRHLGSADRAAVVEFNTRVRILQPFTGDQARLEQAVAAARARGGTALFMGLYVVLDNFARLERQAGEVRKSAIVVLSDGQDTASLIGEDEVRERARQVGVPLYFISLLSTQQERQLEREGERRRSTPYDFLMKSLAAETGARAFFPQRVEDLNDAYGALAREISHQYTLAYASGAPAADGRFRRIVVRLPGHPEARPRTRAGYYAAGTTVQRLK
jgi:Ca-activated chloride channel family protein